MKLRATMLSSALWLPLAMVPMLGQQQAHAHITFDRKPVEAGSWTKFVMRVPEGCGGSPTTSISVEIPDAFFLPRAMPNGTWKLDVKREKLAKPIESHGMQITEKIRTITWSGNSLPDDFYEEFTFFAQAPKEPGRYPVKVTQVCEKGRADWHEIPKAGQNSRDLKFPAPAVTVDAKPAAPAK